LLVSSADKDQDPPEKEAEYRFQETIERQVYTPHQENGREPKPAPEES
jgi:hypothetical protein